MKKTISKLFMVASMVAAFCGTGFGQVNQNNLGAGCGCPPVSSRPTVNFSTGLGAGAISHTNGINEFAGTVHLDCQHLYHIDSIAGFTAKYYVPKGDSIIIDPGTVVRGVFTSDPANSAALIIERGAKIIADGTKDCGIVFTTDLDNLDGTYALTNVGKWGGLIICGIASNSLVSPANDGGLGIAGKSGEGHCEGFGAANVGNTFGANAGDAVPAFQAFDDNDNSGILRYVSVRHPGALIGGSAAGNEINGISLYSVGRGTTIEHIEILASADDDIEYFGGTVNVKYVAAMFGDDDKYDFDLGYSGKGQFYFAIAADSLNTGNLHTSDNGFECDADDQNASTAISNHSNPVFYNCTMISNGHVNPAGDNTGSAGIQAKELTGGQWHNCIFANFRSGLHLAEARSTAANGRLGDAYDQWTNNASDPYLTTNGGIAQSQILKVKNNVFVVPNDGKHFGFTRGTLVAINGSQAYIKNPPTSVAPTAPTSADSVQFFADGNTIVSSVPGIDYNWALNASNNAFTNQFHATPTPNLTTTDIPSDPFFTKVNYKGAFDANSTGSWMSDWAEVVVKNIYDGNPTDINKDGVTDVNDFLLLVGKYGQLDQ